jgi:hypothetical protein
VFVPALMELITSWRVYLQPPPPNPHEGTTQPAAAVEVWARAKLVYRTERGKLTNLMLRLR